MADAADAADCDIKHPKQPLDNRKPVADVKIPPAPPPSPDLSAVTPAGAAADKAPPPLVYDDGQQTAVALLPPLHPGVATSVMALPKQERPLTKEFLSNTKLGVDDILRYCVANATRVTTEQFVYFMEADKSFGIAGFESAETEQERKRREERDRIMMRLIRECIVRDKKFSVTYSMQLAAAKKRYFHTEALIMSLLDDQHAQLMRSIAPLTPMTHAAIIPDVFCPPGTATVPAPAAPTTARDDQQQQTPQPQPHTPSVAARRRHRIIDRLTKSDPSPGDDDDGRRMWCCSNARRAYREQHGDAVGSACSLCSRSCVLM